MTTAFAGVISSPCVRDPRRPYHARSCAKARMSHLWTAPGYCWGIGTTDLQICVGLLRLPRSDAADCSAPDSSIRFRVRSALIDVIALCANVTEAVVE